MAITEFETKFKRQITGLCSAFLRKSLPGAPILFWMKKGTMRFPQDKPLIMIGPGTGVAAFRSVIQARRNQPLVLMFGCRSQEDDFYYEDEWKSYDNLHLITAFSRQNPSEGKVYV